MTNTRGRITDPILLKHLERDNDAQVAGFRHSRHRKFEARAERLRGKLERRSKRERSQREVGTMLLKSAKPKVREVERTEP